MNGQVLTALAFLCTAAACLVAGAPRRALHTRVPQPAARVATGAGAAGAEAAAGGPSAAPGVLLPVPLVSRVGATLRRRAGVREDDAAARLLGSIVLVALPLALVDPRLGIVAAIVVRIRPVLEHRRRRLAVDRRVVSELPEVTDLVRLGLASGGSILVALRAVAARPTGPVTDALAAVIARVDVGHRMADALEDLPATLGEPIRPLVRALVGSERYGVELGPTLDRLAEEARDDRRRRAQARARRVPVQMLVPLVVCILPAFVVLTLVPTLVATFETLEW